MESLFVFCLNYNLIRKKEREREGERREEREKRREEKRILLYLPNSLQSIWF